MTADPKPPNHTARFWITFEADFTAGGSNVQRVKAVNLTQTAPQNGRGVPIEFDVELPDEIFLGRQFVVSVAVNPPSSPTPGVTAKPGSKWEEALKRRGT